jgi:hypothetical protein
MRNAGSGRVIFTAFDFAAAPVKYWEGQNALWRKLLGDRPSRQLLAKLAEAEVDYYSRLGGTGPNLGLAQVASAMPEAELPSMWLIVGFLVAYIVVLVPVNYSLLHRLDRRELAWVTTPAIVVVFTLGAYAIGYGMRGGTIVLNRLAIIEAHGGATAAHGMGYLGLFSPARTTYEIALDPSAEGARDLALQDQHVRGRTTVLSGPKPRIADVVMNMWTTRPFGVEFLADLGNGITGYLEYDGSAFVGRVKNGSALTLDDCHVVRGTARGKGTKLNPGEEAEAAFRPSQTTPVPQPPQYPQGRARSVRLDQSAMSALLSVQSARRYSGTGAPMLVATTKSIAAPATLRGKKPSVNDATLVVVHLPIRLARHQVIQIPSWLVSGRVIATTGSVSSGDPYSGGNPEEFEIEQGSMVTEFAVPAEGGAMEAQRVELTTSSGAGVDPAVEVAAYDFRHRRWETLRARTAIPPATPSGTGGRGGRGRRPSPAPAGGGQGPNTVAFPRPQDFMSPDGRVQVQVSVPSGTATVGLFLLNATVRTQ